MGKEINLLTTAVPRRFVPSEDAPVREEEAPLCDHGGGSNGGDFSDFGDWDDGPGDNDGRQREYWFTPRGAYPAAVLVGIVSIASLFATISTVVELRWVHSKQWAAIPLPGVLYANTLVLLMIGPRFFDPKAGLVSGKI